MSFDFGEPESLSKLRLIWLRGLFMAVMGRAEEELIFRGLLKGRATLIDDGVLLLLASSQGMPPW